MRPARETRLLGDIRKDHRSFIDKPSRGDRPVLFVINRLGGRPRGLSGAHSRTLRRRSLRAHRRAVESQQQRVEMLDGTAPNRLPQGKSVLYGVEHLSRACGRPSGDACERGAGSDSVVGTIDKMQDRAPEAWKWNRPDWVHGTNGSDESNGSMDRWTDNRQRRYSSMTTTANPAPVSGPVASPA